MTSPNEFTLKHWPAAVRAFHPEFAVVLGSGLAALAGAVSIGAAVPYADIAGLSCSTVPGHEGRFLFGILHGRRVVIASGRVHLYEGHSARQTAAGIRCLAALGVGTVVLTNAAGSANPAFAPGSWMMLCDHINLTAQSPLTGGPDFIDMTEVYCPRLRGVFRNAAKIARVGLHEGVYLAVQGPQYETPAEVRAFRSLGADAVGMSTVNEAVQARALGMRVAGFSCLTNAAAGLGSAPLHHGEVVETSRRAADDFLALLENAIPQF